MTMIAETDYGYLSCPDDISLTLESDLFDDLMFGEGDVEAITGGEDWKHFNRLLSLEGISNKAQQDLSESRVPESHRLINDSNRVDLVPDQIDICTHRQRRRKRTYEREDPYTTPSDYYSPIVKRNRTGLTLERPVSPNPISCDTSVITQSSDALPTPSVTSSHSDATILSFMSTDQLNRQLCYMAGRLARSMEKSESSRYTLYQQGLIGGDRLWLDKDSNRA
eukprot:CAMPEP_0204623530 /NCGR_PEP_ID=MMETSP0717-20131115/9262_1 /ASSEMBLY_ACC=CAM_ASM_000666 /TAXON_ID=230516 /ORGANISM="Chaetoceros curvisetus" /LENGTH=222 /DNA_ID=CAMNT_0051638641 /DNA_START=18 /DNA_END=686 /DNA_ORIENTATION=+